jgi:hypothetical protein
MGLAWQRNEMSINNMNQQWHHQNNNGAFMDIGARGWHNHRENGRRISAAWERNVMAEQSYMAMGMGDMYHHNNNNNNNNVVISNISRHGCIMEHRAGINNNHRR